MGFMKKLYQMKAEGGNYRKYLPREAPEGDPDLDWLEDLDLDDRKDLKGPNV